MVSLLAMETDARTWLAPRPTMHGTRHAVSSGHYLASAAGFAILEAGGNAARLVNNFDWMKGFSYLEFLRDVGKH